MTLTNHFMTGAAIAAVVQRPALAVPLAFASHFVIDAIPHYGYGNIPLQQRDAKRHFVLKQTIDTYFGLGLFWLVPYLMRSVQTPLVTQLCMLAAFIPDAIWTVHYVIAQRSGVYKELNRFNRFHKTIQWCERTWGIYVEALWFILIILTIRYITL